MPSDDRVVAPILASQPNFRDLGGTPLADGRRVCNEVVYRSGELSRLTQDDRARLAGLGVRTIVDLRSDAEVDERGADHVPAGATLQRLPILEADRLQAELTARLARGEYSVPEDDPMEKIYRSLVRNWMPAFRSVIDTVVDGALPVVIHCTHGKDRAGMAAAMILAAAGAEWPAIETDYMLSNARREQENNLRLEQIAELVAQRSERPADELDLDWMRGLFFVEPRYLAAARSEIEKLYGSTSELLARGLGLDVVRLERLRAHLIAP